MPRVVKPLAGAWRPRLDMLISLLVAVMVAATLGAGLWLFLGQQRSALEQAQGTRVMDLARVVAERRDVAAALEGQDAGGLPGRIERLREALGVDFIVVMDRRARRLTHPDPQRLGRPFEGGDEGPALAGERYVSRAEGTLGTSLRGFAPVRGEAGEVLGAVAVGVTLDSLLPTLAEHRRHLLVAALGLLLLAALGVGGLARYLKRVLLGLEPHQIARLVEERQAVLGSVHEGLLAVDREGRITLANAAAGRLLAGAGLAAPRPGMGLADYLPAGALRQGFGSDRPRLDRELLLNGRSLMASFVPIHHQGRWIGVVASLRDKGEVDRLAEELTGVRRYAEALRAASHDFKNRLHVIAGLARLGDLAALRRYLNELTRGVADGETLEAEVRDPLLAGFLLGKLSEARERGIALRVATEGGVPTLPSPALAHTLVTVLGNLLENAFEALAEVEERRVTLTLAVDARLLTCEVQDTGPGIAPALRERVAEPGVSAKGEGRGLGLALARERLALHGGRLALYSAPGQGTLAEVSLPLDGPATPEEDA